MKSTFLVLILLITSPLRLKDACKSTTKPEPVPVKGTMELEKPVERPQEADVLPSKCYMIVIGAGPQLVAFLAQLEKSGMLPFVLVIIEMKPEFGTGLPFDEKIANPEHLLNSFGADQVAISGEELEFASWVLQHQALVSNGQNIQRLDRLKSSPPKRTTIGKYLNQRFYDYIGKCQVKGFTIHFKSSTKGKNIKLDESGFVAVDMAIGKETNLHSVIAENVLLATGHSFQKRLDDLPGVYFKSPWPALKLEENIRPGTKRIHIGIMDTKLGGIDAVLTITHNFGSFKNSDTDYETSKKFLITMYSRSGRLPGIVADARNEYTQHTPKHMTDKKVAEGTLDDESKFGDIFKRLKLDLLELIPIEVEKTEIGTLPHKVFFDRLDKALIGDPEQAFRNDYADKNVLRDTENKIDNLFRESDALFQKYWHAVKAEDAVIYKEHFAPRIQKAYARLPMANARKLHTLMEKGHLKLVALGNDYEALKKDGNKVTLKLGAAEPIVHDYWIDAMGQSGHIRKDTRKLTQSLLESGLLQPRRIPYSFGKLEDARNVLENKESLKQIEGVDKARSSADDYGNIWYESDGVEMDPNTMRATPQDGVSTKSKIYVSIPFTFSYYPDSQTLKSAVDIATKVVNGMKAVRATEVEQ